MSSYASEILIRHNLIPLPPHCTGVIGNITTVATIINNLTYYGYALSEIAYHQLNNASEKDIADWWQKIQPILKKITGDDKKMTDYVVYKNFPREVLSMSEAQYWLKQILMYWGLPHRYFTEKEKERPQLQEKLNLRVLQPSKSNSLLQIFEKLLYLPNRWTEGQWHDIVYLLGQFENKVDTDKIIFKENLIKILKYYLGKNKQIKVNSATDVLRLAIALSQGDISFKNPCKFRSFKRYERKFLLTLLNQNSNLEEDIWRRKNIWKKLMYGLHPGDYGSEFSKVVVAYDHLYHNKKTFNTFNGRLEFLLEKRDPKVLQLLSTRPGEFYRRLHNCISLFGLEGAIAFEQVIPQLKTIQLLKLYKYLETINYRLYRIFPPKGNWTKMQIQKIQESQPVETPIQERLLTVIGKEIKNKISPIVPKVNLDSETDLIKLQTNDSDLTSYGRGTVFTIPENITFIRTASYWRSGETQYNIWYDNGWNFFNELWNPLGSCCWDYPYFGDNAAIFSGDPTNSKTMDGDACQLIDLYLPSLLQANVRYALWNILCYSRQSFDEAKEVYAALQWGEYPEKGNLFEPRRCQLSFPLKGKNFTKYIAVIDLPKNHLIYIDANLKASVRSASANLYSLEKNMPPFMEYLDTLPSVFDLFKHQSTSEDGLSVAYSDENLILEGQEAYIFRPTNFNNNFIPFSLTKIFNL
jgi:hypothetical protein